MDLIRAAQPQTAATRAVNQEFSAKHIPLLAKYQSDPLPALRQESLRRLASLGSRLAVASLRRPVVDRLAEGLSDTDSGVREIALSQLQTRHEDDFSPEVQAQIAEEIDAPGGSPAPILLAGIAQVRAAEPSLRPLAAQAESSPDSGAAWRESRPWAALRALARLGDPGAIQGCPDRVANHPDQHERVADLFPQLAYITQPQVVAFLRIKLAKDGPAPAVSGPRDASYADHIARLTSRMVEGFPVATGRGQSVPTEARAWFDIHPEYTFTRSSRRGTI